MEHSRPATNAVLVKGLKAKDRDRLRAALEAVRPVHELRRDLLFKE